MKIHSWNLRQWFTMLFSVGTSFIVNSYCFIPRMYEGWILKCISKEIPITYHTCMLSMSQKVYKQWVKEFPSFFLDHKIQWSRNANMTNKSIKKRRKITKHQSSNQYLFWFIRICGTRMDKASSQSTFDINRFERRYCTPFFNIFDGKYCAHEWKEILWVATMWICCDRFSVKILKM